MSTASFLYDLPAEGTPFVLSVDGMGFSRGIGFWARIMRQVSVGKTSISRLLMQSMDRLQKQRDLRNATIDADFVNSGAARKGNRTKTFFLHH